MDLDLGTIQWGDDGLVTVVVQDRLTGEVRMLAHANDEALRRTLETGEGHFFSRSRRSIWRKGETSGNTLRVREVHADCDRDAVLYLVDPTGPTCHTGARSCFTPAATALVALWDTLEARRSAGTSQTSYTKSLLDAGAEKIGEKLREEADELARAVVSESPERVVSEGADVIFHALVALLSRGATLRDVEAELARRLGTSGHVEKRARTSPA